ncbi:MAG TPA: TerB family tellurite resistance protein [Planctomycetota bacterium]|nr:TerB family tellurite resistance protein [Planctomycetota bacterium]
MAISEKEAVASLRVLVLVAKADGKLAKEERDSLESSLQNISLPKGVTLQNLLDEETNLDFQLKQLTGSEAQEACYTSAYAMAYADGECSPEEQKMLDHIKNTYKLSDEKTTILGRLFSEAKDTMLPSNIKFVADPTKRAAEVKEDTLKYSILSAVLGAFPVPGLAIVTDLAVIGVQVKLIRDIGQYYGHQIDKAAAKSLLLGVGVGAGARIAVNNLAKFIPVFGSAVGATTSFASTWAVGKMAVAYFENGCKADMNVLKKAFTEGQKEGKAAYNENKGVIEAKAKEKQEKIKALSEQRKAGKITQEEYEKQVDALA